MMKQTGIVLCLWAMLALIGPATTAANDDRYSPGGNDAEDEYKQKTYAGPYRGQRLEPRAGPFGKVLDNAGVQTWGAIPALRSTYQETGEGETRALWSSSGKGGKKGKGSHVYEKPVTNYNYGKGKGGYPQQYYDYDYGKGKGGSKGSKKSGKGGKGNRRPVVHPPIPDVPDDDMVPPPDPDPDTCSRSGIDFLQEIEVQTVFVDNAFQNPLDLGTVFIFNDNIFNATDGIVEIAGSFATGTCTRTQNSLTKNVGGGICHFVYTLSDSDGNFATFTTQGEVFDEAGGILSITGGAQAFIGAAGEVQILPFSAQFDADGNLIGDFEPWLGDFFEADLYRVRAELVTGDCS